MKIKKRYIFGLITIVCIVLQVYVLYTPNPNDDDIPYKLKKALYLLIAADQ